MRQPIITESDWLEASRPTNMLRFLGDRVTDRKVNLLAAACFRRIWHLLKTERGRQAVEVLEQFVEGKASAEQWAEAKENAWQSTMEIPNPHGKRLPEYQALGAIGLKDDPWDMIMDAAEATAWVHAGTPQAVSKPEEMAQCAVVRELFGNPFRSVAFAPSWRTDTAVSLAHQMYDSRDFGAMAILADALQDAGCDNEDILSHCRDANATHVRGCWVVDLVLGKE